MRHMYANLTVMTVLNLNHFYIMQAELYLIGTSVKTSFTIATIFYIFIKILGEKSLLTGPVQSILK